MSDTFFEKKGEASKCFRYKSYKTRKWVATDEFNFYPVCYEYQCI